MPPPANSSPHSFATYPANSQLSLGFSNMAALNFTSSPGFLCPTARNAMRLSSGRVAIALLMLC